MKKIRESFNALVEGSKTEAKETKEMVELIWDAKSKKLTTEEKGKIKDQGLDIFKITFLTALFIVPFGSLLVVGLVKIANKFGIKIIPDGFRKDNK